MGIGQFLGAGLPAFVLGAVALAAAASAQDVVGRTSALRPAALQTAPQAAPAELKMNDPVYRDAALETRPDAALEVTFADNSKLSIGPSSNAVIDEFTYAGPAGGAAVNAQVINYSKGLFRYVSGSMPKDKVQLKTPLVTIGIRGTKVRTAVAGDGTTTVGVDSGIVTVQIGATGDVVEIVPGTKVTFYPGGRRGAVEQGPVDGCDF